MGHLNCWGKEENRAGKTSKKRDENQIHRFECEGFER